MVPERRTGNLPADASSFVGRRRLVSRTRRRLSAARLVTLTGAGGVGKTRLALRVATGARHSFPDGVWMVRLAELEDPELLPRAVGAALGLDDPSASAPLTRLEEYLRDKRPLLVLDNCEHLLDASTALIGKLLGGCPGLRVLTTSRQALGAEGEVVLAVPPLPVPRSDQFPPDTDAVAYDGVRLFAERAAGALPGFRLDGDNQAAAARLCQRLDGIPLAIELAAGQLRSLSLEKILDRLDHRLLAVSTGPPAERCRHQTLLAAIDWTFDLCTAKEQLLWARLSVFAGGFDLRAVHEVCVGDGIDQEDVFDLVAGLVDRSVLLRDGHGVTARYRFLEVVRQFGRARLAAAGNEPALRTRHRDYYRRLAVRAEAEWFGPQQVEWLNRLQREHANLRVALRFSLSEPGQARAALEMAGYLRSFWMGSGLVGEGRRWLDQALRLDREPTAVRARGLWVAGSLAVMRGDLAPAAALLTEGTALAARLGDASAMAYCTQYSGLVALFEGDFARAMTLLEQGLDAHRASGDLNGLTNGLIQLLSATSVAGDPRAAALGEECLLLCEIHGAQWSRSYALWAIGLRKWRQGQLAQSARLVRKAIALKRFFYDPLGTGLCLELLAWVAAVEGRYRRAATLLGAGETAWQLSGNALIMAEPDLASHDRCERSARDALGEREFAAAFHHGASLTVAGAVTEAMHDAAEPAEE